MTDASQANKARNREIAQNEEAKQVVGSVRISAWAITAAIVVCTILFAIGWIAYRQ